MDNSTKEKIQQQVDSVNDQYILNINVAGVPKDFKAWTSGMSPSAMYSCSLHCRKKLKLKTPEVKWMSVKRWSQYSPSGIKLPDGVYLSVKRLETYAAYPAPELSKTEYIILMFRYGNVWSQYSSILPITEEWMWSKNQTGMSNFESLMKKDYSVPINNYTAVCYRYYVDNPDQMGIHLKRKRNDK
jgi:hypothetical protein